MKKLMLAILATGALATPAWGQITINEIRIDMPGSDVNEFFELTGAGGSSLAGLTYIVIGDGAGGSGQIEAVIDLSGQSLNSSGFFFAAEDVNTFGFTADLFSTSLLNFENSDNVTHMLVSGFTGLNGDDLDTNDDGVLDSTPWSGVLDSVSLVENLTTPPTTTEWWYSSTTVGPDGSFVPGHIFRDLNNPASWLIGSFGPSGLDTPGFANVPSPGVLALWGLAGIATGRRRRR